MKLNNLAHPWSNVQSNKQKLKVKANSSFIYIHNPKNWELVNFKVDKKAVPRLLPKLGVLRLTPGVNLVRKNGNAINSSIAIANLEDRGFTIIDPNKFDYLRVYPCINGSRYEDRFTVFEQLGGSLITSFNHEEFNEFRCQLMREGALDLPHEHFIKLMINENQKLIDKYSQLQHNPNHAALYKNAIQKDKDLKQAKQALKKDGVIVYE
jgi:hypothetical protein